MWWLIWDLCEVGLDMVFVVLFGEKMYGNRFVEWVFVVGVFFVLIDFDVFCVVWVDDVWGVLFVWVWSEWVKNLLVVGIIGSVGKMIVKSYVVVVLDVYFMLVFNIMFVIVCFLV